MRARSSIERRILVVLLCASLTIPLLPFEAAADVKDKVIIHVGKPSVWSRGQAHYLLAKMHVRNQTLEPPDLDRNLLNPNATNATRIQIIKTLLDFEAQLNERIGVTNRINMQERDFQVKRRERAQLELPGRERELERTTNKL